MSTNLSDEDLPRSYHVGQSLNWKSEPIRAVAFTELPFWIMMPNCVLDVEVNGHTFKVDIRDDFVEYYVNMITDSRQSCSYLGIHSESIITEFTEATKSDDVSSLPRKSKTVVRINSACICDVFAALKDGGRRSNEAFTYLQAFCEAQIEILNSLINGYRLATYDFFAFEVSPWDVPIWFVESEIASELIVLPDYKRWDFKPVIGPSEGPYLPFEFISPADLQSKLKYRPTPGETDLLDAINLMERGGYSDAVRRICTAIEAVTKFALQQELLERYSERETEERLLKSRNDFPG